MDTKHRHELKTNELADWIGHLPEFFRKNYMQVIGVALIIAGLVGVPIFNRVRRNTIAKQYAETTSLIQQITQAKIMVIRNAGMGMQNALLVSASALETAAKEAKNPHSAALAFIKRAEALRTDLHYQPGNVERSVVQAQVSQAKKAYEQAIEKAQGNNTLVAMARLGLGLCAEEVGNFNQAQQIYQQIASNQDFEGTVFGAQAQLRLELIDDNKAKFVFVTAPAPSLAPAQTPLQMPEILDTDTPAEMVGPPEQITVEPETSGTESGTPPDTESSRPTEAPDKTPETESETN